MNIAIDIDDRKNATLSGDEYTVKIAPSTGARGISIVSIAGKSAD